MVDEVDDVAVDGNEGEVASEDLRSVIQGALDKQRETTPDEPVEASSGPEKVAREDGRDEKGRFAPKGAVEAAPVEETAQEPEAATEAPKPPIGWSVAAKADWGNLPPHIQEAVAKREQEVSQGFARYSGLKQFAEIAEQNGTTLAAAVQDYAKVEDGLRRDFLGGLDDLAARFGYRPSDVAQYYAARHGVPQGQIGQGYQQPQFNPDEIISAAEQRALARFEETQVRRESATEIERFAADPAHTYFDNVREDMALLLQNGKASDLASAYEMACWANPETRAILLKSQSNSSPSPQAAVQKAKAAAKAVGGAPSPGFNPGAKANQPKATLRDEIMATVAAQR
jgi:hypothetical protein